MECTRSSEFWQWLWWLSGLMFHSRSHLDLDFSTVDLRGFSEDHLGLLLWAAHILFLHLFFSCSGCFPSARPLCMVHRISPFEDALSFTNFCVHQGWKGDFPAVDKSCSPWFGRLLETRHLIVGSLLVRLSYHESTNLLLATTQFIGLNSSLSLVKEVGMLVT